MSLRCCQTRLHVDEVFPLLVILLVSDVAQRHADQERYQARHENAQIVDLFVDVVIGTSCVQVGN